MRTKTSVLEVGQWYADIIGDDREVTLLRFHSFDEYYNPYFDLVSDEYYERCSNGLVGFDDTTFYLPSEDDLLNLKIR